MQITKQKHMSRTAEPRNGILERKFSRRENKHDKPRAPFLFYCLLHFYLENKT